MTKFLKKIAEDKPDEPIVIEKPKIDGSKVIYIPDGDDDLNSDHEDETETEDTDDTNEFSS